MNLTDLNTFVLVATLGSMTAAAKKLDVPKSTVSRRIRRLEESLRLSLLSRTPNRVRLTSQGELLRDRCAPALSVLVDAERELRGVATEPTGLVRLTTPPALGYAPALSTILSEYQLRFPRVNVEVVTTDAVLDFEEANIDLAVRPASVASSGGGIIEQVLGRLDVGVYASPAYLERQGEPTTLDELPERVRVAHDPLMRRSVPLQSASGKIRSVALGRVSMWTTNFGHVLQATLQNQTVGLLPTFLADPEVERGNLVLLFRQWRMQGGSLGLAWPAGRTVLPKTRALIDLFTERAVPSGLVSEIPQ